MLQGITSASRKLIPATTAIVQIITGQSNAAGRENQATLLSPDLQAVNTNVKVVNYGSYTNTTTFGAFSVQSMQADVNTWSLWNYAITGMEPTLMKLIQQKYARPVFLLKIAFGGYDISHWAPGGDFYAAFNKAITDLEAYLLSNGYTAVHYVSAVWAQGESDAELNTANYATKLMAFISYLRSRSAYTANMPIYLQRLSSLQSYYSQPAKDYINGEFDTVKATMSKIFQYNPADYDPGIESDNIHYPTPGMQKMASGVFAKFLSDRII